VCGWKGRQEEHQDAPVTRRLHSSDSAPHHRVWRAALPSTREVGTWVKRFIGRPRAKVAPVVQSPQLLSLFLSLRRMLSNTNCVKGIFCSANFKYALRTSEAQLMILVRGCRQLLTHFWAQASRDVDTGHSPGTPCGAYLSRHRCSPNSRLPIRVRVCFSLNIYYPIFEAWGSDMISYPRKILFMVILQIFTPTIF
jgi:hypothetical protein